MITTPTTIHAVREALASRDRHGYLTLNSILEFDHVVQVHEDGRITDGPDGMYGPDYLEGRSDGTRETVEGEWDLMTDGYTGQDGYSGPIMHNSEFIGGRLAEDILDTPGLYVALVCYWPDDEDSDENETYAEGWAIAYREA